TNLRELTLTRTRVQGPGLDHLAGMEKLHTLRLSTPALARDVVPRLRALTRLRWLELCYVPLEDADLADLAGLTRLERLDLSQESRITDKGLKHLHGLTRLRTLSFGGPEVTEAGLEELRGRLPRLQTLRVEAPGR